MKVFNPKIHNNILNSQIGNKAYNLFKYKIKNTPNFICVTIDAFTNNKLDDDAKCDILKYLSKNKKYAIRSSAIDEDSCEHSFAGIHESYLNVEYKNVIEYVQKCYNSAFTDLSINYRRQNNLPVDNIKMAVLIQEMIESEYSGVINTINPITNNPDEIVISIVEGLGEKLVSGEVNSTDYYINGTKIKKIGSLELDSRIIKKIIKLANEVNQKSSTFQDIEFAYKKNKVYFLQTRPIVPFKHINTKKEKITLDNSNIIESYNNVTTNLTYSFAHEIYKNIYTQTLRVGKVNEKIIKALEKYLEDMILFNENRIYYNLNSWYALVSVFPSKLGTRYMENMMGVSCELTNIKLPKMNIFSILNIGRLFLKKLKTIDEDSNKFIEKFDRVVMPKVGFNFENYSSQEIVEYYHNLEKEILDDFTTPIINDSGAMFFMGRFKNFMIKNKIENPEGVLANLVSKQGNVESAFSIDRFNDIIKKINYYEDIKKDFQQLDSSTLYKKYINDERLKNEIETYLKWFGSRVMDELKLETITMIEEPIYLFQMIQNFIINNSNLKEDNFNKEHINIEIKNKKKFNYLLEKTKYFIRNRERLRLKRTYIFSVVRNMFLRIGKNFVNDNIIDNYRDIFYLEKDEIFTIIKNNSKQNMREVVNKRKEEYQNNYNKPMYNRIVKYGKETLKIEMYNDKNTALKGIGSGCGVVKGIVKYVENIQDTDVVDKIVLAYRTDPGWVVLFPLCKGLIVERGSILSHSSVVAREIGLPAVVGVHNVTKLLKDNDLVILDAIKGEITVEK